MKGIAHHSTFFVQVRKNQRKKKESPRHFFIIPAHCILPSHDLNFPIPFAGTLSCVGGDTISTTNRSDGDHFPHSVLSEEGKERRQLLANPKDHHFAMGPIRFLQLGVSLAVGAFCVSHVAADDGVSVSLGRSLEAKVTELGATLPECTVRVNLSCSVLSWPLSLPTILSTMLKLTRAS